MEVIRSWGRKLYTWDLCCYQKGLRKTSYFFLYSQTQLEDDICVKEGDLIPNTEPTYILTMNFSTSGLLALCAKVFTMDGVQVRESHPFLSLVYPVCSLAWFLCYNYNMIMCQFGLNSHWQMYRVALFLLPRISHLSVSAELMMVERWYLWVHPGTQWSFILKTESKGAYKMEFLKARYSLK